MTATALPRLDGAGWFSSAPVRRVFDVIGTDGDAVRVIGGAVRNALLGRPIADIDFATTATPDVVMARAAAAGIKTVPTGIDHGTLTLVVAGAGYEVTTLRQDVATDGRHAVVRFGDDFEADARRRDFTMNALSVDAGGTLHDPVGGYGDLVAGRVRFIGEAAERIAEDRLRILRFFRFHAEYGRGGLDGDGLAAAIRARDGLRDLSAERIGQEMRKLVAAPRAAGTLAVMQEAGILGVVLGGVAYLGPFGRLACLEAAFGATPSPPLRLAGLGCRVKEDVLRLTDRLRLSNKERDRMLAGLVAGRSFAAPPAGQKGRELLYRLGAEAFRDGVSLGFAWGGDPPEDARWAGLYRLPERFTPPAFPLSGRDLLSAGAPGGPPVGAMLRNLEAWWIAEDFAPDKAALLARLQQMIAASQ